MFSPLLRAVRETAPLVHVITNFVTVNDCANIILAAGGSPTMARDVREVTEFTAGCRALVLNLGAVANAEAMLMAGTCANELGRPVVLDPVAVGASTLRRTLAAQLLRELHFSVIRGNGSEIRALAQGCTAGQGVDADASDLTGEATLPRAVELASLLSLRTGAVVVSSGPLDVVSDGTCTLILRNGCPTMGRITGSGCMLTALTGAFCAASPDKPFLAAAAAAAAMGVCGELAEARRLKNGTGTATFRTDLIDAVSNLTPEQLTGGAHYERYP